ncbi:MAG: hypothetical protein JJ891_13005 [Rhizobiaceae bacterium]|jgi:hypothetical protein|nr:hypothetical protein [Rhizobiaceae bacterium]
MAEYSDQNLEHVLEDPGAYFDRPDEVAASSLTTKNKLLVLNAWRRWLLSDEWHAENTDESQANKQLAEIEMTEHKISAQGKSD